MINESKNFTLKILRRIKKCTYITAYSQYTNKYYSHFSQFLVRYYCRFFNDSLFLSHFVLYIFKHYSMMHIIILFLYFSSLIIFFKYLGIRIDKNKNILEYMKLFNNCLYTFCLSRLVPSYNTHSEFSTKIIFQCDVQNKLSYLCL